MDYYSILGVSRNATQEDIKKAFRRLAHQYHPDKKGGDEKKFKEVNEAYQILGNQEKRAKYDQFDPAFANAGAGFNGFSGQGSPGFDFNGFNFDFSQGAGGDFFNVFENFFNFGSQEKEKQEMNRGDDFEYTIEISLKEASLGVNKKIEVERMGACQRCNGLGAEPGTELKECFSCRGRGFVQQIKKTFLGQITREAVCPQCKGQGRIPDKPCNVCKGEGRVVSVEEIEIKIPAGVDTGQTIKITGQGDAGRRGSKAGNLYIRVKVKPHPVFMRRGDDLFAQAVIGFPDAALGSFVEVEDLEGKKLEIKIPSGTESGKVLRISGKGVSRFNGIGKGNLYLTIVIAMPKKLNKKQKRLMEELREEGI